MTEHPYPDLAILTDEEARDYVTALNEHAEEQFSRGIESAHGYDEDSFIAGVRWALDREHPEPDTIDALVEERDDLQAELAKLIEVVRKVRAYADDRAFHSMLYNNTVNSGRIASDLYHILNDASLGSSTQWQYSYAEKWVDDSGVYERVTFDTEAKARQYYVDNAPRLVGYNMEQEYEGNKLKAVLEKRRVTEPGEWLPLEAMTRD